MRCGPCEPSGGNGATRYNLRSLYRAVRAEFELAKTLGATAMMPDIVQQIATKGSERGFLDGFYARLRSFSTTHQRNATIFLTDWQKHYENAVK